VTDLPTSKRVAYVGIDNRTAGATAAYLVQQWLADRAGDVLVVRGHGSFRARTSGRWASGPRCAPAQPGRRCSRSSTPEDRADAVRIGTREVLAANPSVRAVYSLYAGAGGNAAVVDAFDAEGRNYDVFVAHDLDGRTRRCCASAKLSAVLHHDLRMDLRTPARR
jgi:LacI family transcriptional regulator